MHTIHVTQAQQHLSELIDQTLSGTLVYGTLNEGLDGYIAVHCPELKCCITQGH